MSYKDGFPYKRLHKEGFHVEGPSAADLIRKLKEAGRYDVPMAEMPEWATHIDFEKAYMHIPAATTMLEFPKAATIIHPEEIESVGGELTMDTHARFPYRDVEHKRISSGCIVRYKHDVVTTLIFEVDRLADDKDGCYPLRGSIVLQSELLDEAKMTLSDNFLKSLYENGCSCTRCNVLEYPNGKATHDTPLENLILRTYNGRAF